MGGETISKHDLSIIAYTQQYVDAYRECYNVLQFEVMKTHVIIMDQYLQQKALTLVSIAQ